MPTFKLTLRDKIIIGVIIALTIFIPTGTYVLSLRFKTQSQAQEYKYPVTSPRTEATTSSRLKDALDRLQGASSGSPEESQSRTETGTEDNSSSLSGAQLVLGPTLGFSVILQGRPLDNQSTQAFLGIAAGVPTTRPSYLLSFMVSIPASGSFDGISLSGLETGLTYTAYLKGAAQIATSSAFVVKATPTNLGALNLLTGDINEDNVVDILDYNLVKGAFGTTPSSNKWNPLYDFNMDNVINSFDLNTISANLNKTGASGAWYSYTPVATASALTSGSPADQLETNEGKKEGYWMWVPGI